MSNQTSITDSGTWYMAETDGMWYPTAAAAGTVVAVRVDGITHESPVCACGQRMSLDNDNWQCFSEDCRNYKPLNFNL
jgi:hypothetical protein